MFYIKINFTAITKNKIINNMNIFEYFDLTQIVNLPSRKDRRQETELEFKKYGFPINVKKSSFFKAISPTTPEGFSNCGVRGCFLSHMRIIENAVTSKLNNILILEDDIYFSKNILKYDSIAIKELDNIDWDFAYFGHKLPTSTNENIWKEIDEPVFMTHFYAINGKILPQFLEFLQNLLSRPPGHPQGGPMHYDGAINTFLKQNSNIKAYFFSKNLGYQRPSKTDLHETTIFDKYLILIIFTLFFRKIKRFFLKITI